jgi:hypothetical protein
MKKPTTHTPQVVEEDTGRYEFDTFGDWIGYVGSHRTMLKATLEAAKADVRTGRFVCPCWPNCRHKGPN